MIKSFILAIVMTVATSAQAANTNSMSGFIVEAQVASIQENVVALAPNWKVGDENNYKLNLGGFLNGTMKMFIREIGADGIWMVQDVDLVIQKQKAEILIDPNTGEIKKILVDGKEQTIPASDIEIVEQKEATVTVPAGTYPAIYLKIKDNANKGAISENWINPRDIPISGMLKSIQDSQLGKMTIELTSFIKK
jgi:hypothetical protein